MSHILITGAAGYIGSQIVPLLVKKGHGVDQLDMRRMTIQPHGETSRAPIDLEGGENRPSHPYEVVVHLAGMAGTGENIAQNDYHRNNVDLTGRAAELAVRIGAKRLIFASSVLAMVGHHAEGVVTDESPAKPVTGYGRSKLAAERHVVDFAKSGRLGISLRIPAVVGRYPKGNWRLLMRLAGTRLPLPIASVQNQRSYVSIETLANAVDAIITKPLSHSPSGSYLIADNGYLSLPDILASMRDGMGLRRHLFSAPQALMVRGLGMIGKGREAQSLFGDLRVDGGRFASTFGVASDADLRAAIERQAANFLRKGN